MISIHALREEGDGTGRAGCAGHLGISIHALREEGDVVLDIHRRNQCPFLSTPSARRATEKITEDIKRFSISIHALREEGDHMCSVRQTDICISIHALREEGDFGVVVFSGILDNFYPRPPRGGRHKPRYLSSTGEAISIHALREEGDGVRAFLGL